MNAALGYVRVSTDEQANSGAGLEAQRAAILREARRRGWTVVEVIEDAGYSGQSLKRPGLTDALDALCAGRADTLVVAKLDRLSRSLLDFALLMNRATREGWALVALDLGVDTTTPQGEMVANVMATFAQFERRLIAQRTREALAVKRREGVRLGRPVEVPDSVYERIQAWRAEGLSYGRIADRLNREHVPTARGGDRWYASSVHASLRARRR